MTRPISAADVQAERVDWLWRERIPRGMITTVAGRPNQGKGLFAAHVAATVTQAGGRVLYSAAEDSAGLMTRPRLEAAGAALENVLLWRFQLPANASEVAEIVVNEEIDLIVMDPFAAHLGGGITRHSDNVRQVLQPLTELIERTGTACLVIEHALKRIPVNGHPLAAIGGSGSGLPAASRAAYVLGVDPDDEDRRVLAPVKFNIGSSPAALSFEVDVAEVDGAGEHAHLVYEDELMAFDPMRLLAAPKPGDRKVGRPADKRAAAAEWLTTYLATQGQPVKSSRIQEDAKQYGMATKTLRRAAEDMGVVKNPPGGGRNCTWWLSEEVCDLMGIDFEQDPSTDAPADPDDGTAVAPLTEDAFTAMMETGDDA